MQRMETDKIQCWLRLSGMLLFIFVLSGCYPSPQIEFVRTEQSEAEGRINVFVQSDTDIFQLANRYDIAAVGDFHICGYDDRYTSVDYLDEAPELVEGQYLYKFEFSNSIAEQIDMPPGGGVIGQGWPEDLVRTSGTCIHITGGVLGVYIRSNVVEISAPDELLLHGTTE